MAWDQRQVSQNLLHSNKTIHPFPFSSARIWLVALIMPLGSSNAWLWPRGSRPWMTWMTSMTNWKNSRGHGAMSLCVCWFQPWMASLTATAGLDCRCIIERWAGPLQGSGQHLLLALSEGLFVRRFRCDMASCLDMGQCFSSGKACPKHAPHLTSCCFSRNFIPTEKNHHYAKGLTACWGCWPTLRVRTW